MMLRMKIRDISANNDAAQQYFYDWLFVAIAVPKEIVSSCCFGSLFLPG